MMTQTAPDGEKHFVSTMIEHMDLCAQMGQAYGNDRFESLSPFEEVLYTVANHDRGWDDYDQEPLIDPQTGLPLIMAKTPPTEAVKTNSGSPDFNEAHHPYCGLLSSMHIWGLYNKRYGLSSFALRIRPGTASIPVADDNRTMIDMMLQAEVERQERLKLELAQNATSRTWIETKRLFQNYKQLQFFDTLSLYFHLYHAAERGSETYTHVPLDAEEDAIITVRKIDEQTYSLDPFPFKNDHLRLVCKGRYTGVLPKHRDRAQTGAYLQSLPPDTQNYDLLPLR